MQSEGNQHTSKHAHYERVIVACAFLLLFVNVGFTSTAFSVYQSHLVDVPGVGNVGGSFIVTIRTCVAFFCMFFTGLVYKRINPRIGFAAATLCTVAAFMVFSGAQNFVGFCCASVLAGFGYGFGGMIAATYLIGNWFRGKVGSVSGIATMGSGVAAIIVPVIAGAIIQATSLSVAFFVEGLAALVVAVLVFALVRTTPEEMGLKPIEPPEEAEEAVDAVAASGASAISATAAPASSGASATSTTEAPASSDPQGNHPKSARLHKHPKAKLATVPLPKASYLAMIFAIVLLGGISVAGYNYFGILLTTGGIDPLVAATLISCAGIFLTISKFAVGKVCDKFGTLRGSAAFFILLLIALILCSLVGHGNIPEAAFAAVMLGIGMPLGTTGVSLWSLELSSKESMLKTIRHFQLAYAFGGFAFNMMPGVLAQLTGNYNSTYEVLTAMAVVCAIIILWVYSHHILRARKAYKLSTPNL